MREGSCSKGKERLWTSSVTLGKYGGFCPPDPDAGARMGGHILWALPKARQGHTGASDQEPGPDPTPYVVPKRA
ncbi:unnamed protein product [Rangifer tarandus platyrhynchus]|uniref:Uncharacterized protein n=1 Tax=Rangifer tarandus platyrhynchus TaxID=3082113 RepID=A0ABN8YXA1_RANTA|nr:unnamed protein product [Rangifer tarandus platyrhynchus]